MAAVYGVVVLGFLPWVPSFLAQPHSSSDYAASMPLGASWLAEQSVGLFPGTGYFSWREIPGRPAVIAVVLTLGVLLAAATATVWGRQRRWRHLLEAWGALVVLALVVPIGLLLFSIGGDNVWVSRYLALALPAIVLLLGGLISLAPRPVAWGAAAALIGVLAVGTAKSFDEPYRRAGYKEAARFIESKATPRDVVLEFFLSSNASRRGARYVSPIDLNFAERRRTIVGSLRSARRVFNDPPPEGRVFVAGIEGGFLRLPRPGRDDGLCLVRRRVFPGGDAPVTVYVYGEAGKARPCPEA